MSLAHQVCQPILEAAAGNPTGEPSVPMIFALTVPDAATGDLDWTLPGYAIRVIDAWAIKTAANGAAVNTVQLQTTTTPVTDAMSININDTLIVRAATLDDAQHEFAADATIRVERVKAGGNAAALVYVMAVRT